MNRSRINRSRALALGLAVHAVTSLIQALPQIDLTDFQVLGILEIDQFIQVHYCNVDGEQLIPSDACKQRSCE